MGMEAFLRRGNNNDYYYPPEWRLIFPLTVIPIAVV
jgi:hypothetical protein